MSKYKILVYSAFETDSHCYVKGRILRNLYISSSDKSGPIVSLVHTVIRAFSLEVKCHPIQITYGSEFIKVNTDTEGYFGLFVEKKMISQVYGKLKVRTIISGVEYVIDQPITLYKNAKEGVITDIDDTILVTGVTSFFKLKLLINTIFINPFRRKPIKNASKFLNKKLGSNSANKPLFYLSNSPWNLYDYLRSFLENNYFPNGELILRDMGLQLLKKRQIQEYNKFIECELIFESFPETKFVLIGDTGEKDFDIYKALKESYIHNVEEIILRRAGNRNKETQIEKMIAEGMIGITIIDQFV